MGTHTVDAVVHLLEELRWTREPELVTKGYPDRPVYSRTTKLKTYKVIVGSLWTTYYDIRKDVIGEMDSIRTENFDAVEHKIRELSR